MALRATSGTTGLPSALSAPGFSEAAALAHIRLSCRRGRMPLQAHQAVNGCGAARAQPSPRSRCCPGAVGAAAVRPKKARSAPSPELDPPRRTAAPRAAELPDERRDCSTRSSFQRFRPVLEGEQRGESSVTGRARSQELRRGIDLSAGLAARDSSATITPGDALLLHFALLSRAGWGHLSHQLADGAALGLDRRGRSLADSTDAARAASQVYSSGSVSCSPRGQRTRRVAGPRRRERRRRRRGGCASSPRRSRLAPRKPADRWRARARGPARRRSRLRGAAAASTRASGLVASAFTASTGGTSGPTYADQRRRSTSTEERRPPSWALLARRERVLRCAPLPGARGAAGRGVESLADAGHWRQAAASVRAAIDRHLWNEARLLPAAPGGRGAWQQRRLRIRFDSERVRSRRQCARGPLRSPRTRHTRSGAALRGSRRAAARLGLSRRRPC